VFHFVSGELFRCLLNGKVRGVFISSRVSKLTNPVFAYGVYFSPFSGNAYLELLESKRRAEGHVAPTMN
jgi:hypothetical protein